MEGTGGMEDLAEMEVAEDGVVLVVLVYLDVMVGVKVLQVEMEAVVEMEEGEGAEVMEAMADLVEMEEMQVLVAMFKFEV